MTDDGSASQQPTDDESAPQVPPALHVERQAPDRNLALELVRVTEAAAMAAGRWVGRGDKNGGDGAAVDAMRALIGTVSMSGVVVIGEGEKDEAPMLYNGEEVGDGTGPLCDVAVDPIDGTTLMAKGMPNAIAVIAVSERGTMFDPSAVFYMEKIAAGAEAADVIDITAPVDGEHPPGGEGQARPSRGRHRLHPRPAAARGPRPGRCARPARASSSSPTATSPARSRRPARTPASICCSASAARRKASSPRPRCAAWAASSRHGCGRATTRSGRRRSTPATTSTGCCAPTTWCGANDIFFCATGITDGDLLRGVRYYADSVQTESIVMRSKSGTIRLIDSLHQLGKLRAYSAVDFDRH